MLDDKSLAQAGRINQRATEILRNDLFWQERITYVFGYKLKKYKEEELSYRKMYKFFKINNIINTNIKLIRAAFSGYLSIVKYLIEEHGANPHVDGYDDAEIILINAIYAKHIPLIKYLVEEVKGYNITIMLIRSIMCHNHTDISKYLIEQGASTYFVYNMFIGDINIKDSAFSMAALRGNLSMLKYMIKLEKPDTINLNMASVNAVNFGYFSIVKYLVEQGAYMYFNDAALQRAEER